MSLATFKAPAPFLLLRWILAPLHRVQQQTQRAASAPPARPEQP